MFEEQILVKNLNSEATNGKVLKFTSNIAEAYKNHDTQGIELKFYVKDIVENDTAHEVKNSGKLVKDNVPTVKLNKKNIEISNLKLKANEQGVLVFKLKVVEEDTTDWKIKNEFTISETFQDTTYEKENHSDSRVHPLNFDTTLNKEGYYPQFKRDY